MATWREKLRLARTGNDTPEAGVKPVHMMSYNMTKSGTLTSKGFVSCWGMLLTNTTTGETWGFHTYCPNEGFNEGQKEKIAELGKQPGEKHAELMYGDYYKFMDLKKTERVLTDELKAAVPGVKVKARKVTTQPWEYTDENPYPKWEFAYDAKTREMKVMEHPFPGCLREGRTVVHTEQLFEGVCSRRVRRKEQAAPGLNPRPSP